MGLVNVELIESKKRASQKKKEKNTSNHLSGLGAALAATARAGLAATGLAAIPLETARVAAKEAIVKRAARGGKRASWSKKVREEE